MNKDKRRGHLDHVRSNMTRSDHNTVPALNKTDDAVEAAWQRFRSRLEAGLAGCDPKFIFAAGYQEALASRPTETDGLAGELHGLMALLNEQVELNPSNYDHDDACQLNSQAVEIYSTYRALYPRILTALSKTRVDALASDTQGERDKALKEAFERVRCRNAGNFEREGREWKAYDQAVLDCWAEVTAALKGDRP